MSVKYTYVVEMWSVSLRHDNSHSVDRAHLASTVEGAENWCRENFDYGGEPGMDSYYPWFFKIIQVAVDVDVMNTVGGPDESCVKIIHPAEIESKEKEECEDGEEFTSKYQDHLGLSDCLGQLPNLLRDIAKVVEDYTNG